MPPYLVFDAKFTKPYCCPNDMLVTLYKGQWDQDRINLNYSARNFLGKEFVQKTYCINLDGVKFIKH